MKKEKYIYWITTSLIFVMEGIIPAFTSQTELAKQGISHLEYPFYFANALTIFKVAGAIVLMVPFFPLRVKDFAYAGFTFVFLFASISHFAVDGLNFQSFFPLIFLLLLFFSYRSYHRISGTATSAAPATA